MLNERDQQAMSQGFQFALKIIKNHFITGKKAFLRFNIKRTNDCVFLNNHRLISLLPKHYARKL
jgi:hypothetical protein